MPESWPFHIALPRVFVRMEFGKASGITSEWLQHSRVLIGEAIESVIQASLENLGIPGVPDVELAVVQMPDIVRVLLNGRYRVPSTELVVSAWRQSAASSPDASPAASVFAEHLGHGFAEDRPLFGGALPDLSWQDAAIVGFIEAVMEGIVRSRAAELFGPEQAAYLLADAARHGIAPVDDARASRADPERLAAIIQPSLWAGISLQGRVQDFLQTIAEAGSRDLDDQTIGERLVTRFGAAPEIGLLVGSDLDDSEAESLKTRLQGVYRNDLGFSPDIAIHQNPAGKPGEIRLRANDQIVSSVELIPPGTLLVKIRSAELPGEVQPVIDWITSDAEEASVLPERFRPFLADRAIEIWDRLDWTVECATREIRRHSWRLINADLIETALASVAEEHPELALTAARRIAPERLARVARELVRDRVSIRDFEAILERIVTFERIVVDEWEFVVLDDRLPVHPRLSAISTLPLHEAEMARYIRLGLRHILTYTHSRGRKAIPALLLDTNAIRAQLLDHLADSYGLPGAVRLSAAECDQIRAAISAVLRRHHSAALAPVLLANGSVRQLIRDLIADEFPDLGVLAYDELDSGIEVQQLGLISPRLIQS